MTGLHSAVGLAGAALVSAGVWIGFGPAYGLITAGGLLIFDAIT